MGVLSRGPTVPAPARLPSASGAAIDFARLVGREGWARLPASVRRRFAHAPRAGAPDRYFGVMSRVECSIAGLLLAQLCRLLGTPFAPFRGADVPVAIVLASAEDGEGVAWLREYRFAGRPPIRVRSVKRVDADGGLLECVGGGFGMTLDVFERDGALHFRSRRYFWRGFGLRVPLPHLLSPGVAHVVHVALGERRFHFEMTFRHRWLGELFRQVGEFFATGDAP